MFELRLLCPEERVEPVSEALEALDALSVSVEDADAQTDAERALFGEPGLPPPKEGWLRSQVVRGPGEWVPHLEEAIEDSYDRLLNLSI